MDKNIENTEAGDLYNLSFEEIDDIQNNLDTQNILTVEKAFRQRRINEDERNYMLKFFRDGMGIYREVYRSLYETFGQPEATCSFNPVTGQVDTDAKGMPVNYGLKVVTPFVCTRLEYQDKNNNPIFVIFPKMKSAERAIEKLEKEYGREYNQAMRRALDRMFRDDDHEAFRETLQDIPATTSKLHDILRLTITGKYFTDVERLKRKLSENKSGFFFINPDETRDRFYKPLNENEKQYYDIKMIMHQNNKNGQSFDVEMQLKIDVLFQGDLRTHKIYEEVRKLEAQEQRGNAASGVEEQQKQARIAILNNRIRRINQNAVHQYNMMVLDKARRIEDDGYRPLRIQPEFADGTYKRCRNFIAAEYMVESFDEFDGAEAFAAKDEVNKLCFLRLTEKLAPDFDEFSPHGSEIIQERFAALSPAEINRFNSINEVALRYQTVVRRKINERKAAEQAPHLEIAGQKGQNFR